MRRVRTLTPVLPAQTGRHRGLAYTLWLPEPAPPKAGVVILHGADSGKESHHDFARVLRAAGIASVCFDMRGHGESEPALDDRIADDVAAVADLLRERTRADLPIGLRGSSMGGYLAIVAAAEARARAIVAICPAPAELLRAGLEHRAFSFAADTERLTGYLDGHDLHTALAGLADVPVLILHAAGDERVPVQASRELEPALSHPDSRLIVIPGGHHRSIQHDDELQSVALRFLARALGAR